MKRYAPIFLLPTMVAFAIGFIAPFILGVYLSFCEFTTVTDAKFVGFKNYIRFWNDPSDVFLHSLGFTVLFTIVTVVLINVVGFAVALALTKKKLCSGSLSEPKAHAHCDGLELQRPSLRRLAKPNLGQNGARPA